MAIMKVLILVENNSSMTPILKRAPKMVNDEKKNTEEEVKSCSKLSIKKRKKLTKDISSSESQNQNSKNNYNTIKRFENEVNISNQKGSISSSSKKKNTSPKKKRKSRKSKKKLPIDVPTNASNYSQNISKTVLTGLHSILEEMEVNGHEGNLLSNNLKSGSKCINIAEGGNISNSPETQSGKKARNDCIKKKIKVTDPTRLSVGGSIDNSKLKDMFDIEKIIEGLNKFIEEDEIIKKDENSNLTIPNQKYEYQKSKFAQKSDNFHNSHIKSFKN